MLSIEFRRVNQCFTNERCKGTEGWHTVQLPWLTSCGRCILKVKDTGEEFLLSMHTVAQGRGLRIWRGSAAGPEGHQRCVLPPSEVTPIRRGTILSSLMKPCKAFPIWIYRQITDLRWELSVSTHKNFFIYKSFSIVFEMVNFTERTVSWWGSDILILNLIRLILSVRNTLVTKIVQKSHFILY